MDLSYEHICLLKNISKSNVTRSDPTKNKDIDYLISLELVEAITVDKEEEFYLFPILTEKGKAVLYEKTRATRRANVALVLSIISIVLSFLVAFTPFADWSKQLISMLF
ncbi:MAG: hypothetical protein IJB57_01855 [Clostridia bacterium]|nr:hypothetical protein [Clostridia bacterium]